MRIIIHLNEGGAGSGNKGHAGIKGHQGGSMPTGRQAEPETYVGITTARPEMKDPKRIEAQMHYFSKQLRQMGVQGVRARLGDGAWAWTDDQGQTHLESEPTWVLRYRGNGNALAAIAKLGRQAEQDAVLISTATTSENPNATHRYKWKFAELTPEMTEKIGQLAASVGLGGWTWDKRTRTLYSVTVRQWSNPAEHDAKIQQFCKGMKNLGIAPRLTMQFVETKVMEKSGDNAYERFYQA